MPMNWIGWVLLYVGAASLAGFILMGLDKKKAAEHRWRIPEKTLFLTAAIGGSTGVLIGMFFFRHKTKHLSFRIGIPLILTAQCVIAWVLFRYS